MATFGKIRLYCAAKLGQGQSVSLSRDQAHYLFNVMRKSVGDVISVFNGTDGEWAAEVVEAGKRKGVLVCQLQTQPQQNPPDLWLLFAPIKKARTDFIVEKATELGVARILPVQTDHTNSDRIRQDRLQAHAVEAAEQCGGTFIPPVESLQKLMPLLENWPADRSLIHCDESMAAENGSAFSGNSLEKVAILIGPEGGFSSRELGLVNRMDSVIKARLGPRILRADTAAVAAISLWQNEYGDWQ